MAMALIRQQQQQHRPSNGVPHGLQVREGRLMFSLGLPIQSIRVAAWPGLALLQG